MAWRDFSDRARFWLIGLALLMLALMVAILLSACEALAMTLVELHGPTGQRLAINPAEISSLRQPIDAKGHWASGTQCVVVMTNGKYIAVTEDCATVLQKVR